MKKAKIIFTGIGKDALATGANPRPNPKKKYKQVKPPHDIQVRLKDKSLKGRLQAVAVKKGLSLNRLVEAILADYLYLLPKS